MFKIFMLAIIFIIPSTGHCADKLVTDYAPIQSTNQIGVITVSQPKFTIYTGSYCPYCTRAKNLLDAKNIQYEEIDVTDAASRDTMIQKSNGRKTIPQIFIDDQPIGGFDDLNALNQSGRLDQLLAGK